MDCKKIVKDLTDLQMNLKSMAGSELAESRTSILLSRITDSVDSIRKEAITGNCGCNVALKSNMAPEGSAKAFFNRIFGK